MITVEKFYFGFEEVEISGGAHADDYNLTFVASEDDPLYITIRIRGREEFRKLICEINDLGHGLLGDVN